MRWEQLFDDLEAQLDSASAAETAAEVAERTRQERGRVRLVDRLRAGLGQHVVLRARGGLVVTGQLVDVGADWLLLSHGGRAVLVPLDAVLALSGLGPRAEEPGSEGEVARRFDLRFALRRLVRDRAAVEVVLADGTRVTGTLDGVGADHVELAQHAPDEPRRARSVRQVLLLPLAAVAAVQSG